jgi:type IV secretory pathway VirB10-like protein
MPDIRVKRSPMPKKKQRKEEEEIADTTLDGKKKAIAADEAKVRQAMEKAERLIKIAPKLAQERQRRQREQFVTRASRTEGRANPRTALPDRRYELTAGVPPRQRHLRAERNRGRLMFFVLLIVFAAVIAWLYFTMTGHG